MKLQLWRNATLYLRVHKKCFLIDPMLGEKGSFGVFPWTNDERENPLIDLPFSIDEMKTKLQMVDAVFVSHLHPDHWDEAAVNFIDKSTPILCPASIAESIASFQFEDVHRIQSKLKFNEIEVYLTKGQHGKGEIEEMMGLVNGFVIKYNSQKIYIAGDTIWCDDVKEAIDTHQPQHIIIAGGAATFSIGKPVTMTAKDIKELATYSPFATIWVTHLEAISPCTQDRAYLTEFLIKEGLTDRCKILTDGEEVDIIFNQKTH